MLFHGPSQEQIGSLEEMRGSDKRDACWFACLLITLCTSSSELELVSIVQAISTTRTLRSSCLVCKIG
jgi:hypothetical protein